MVDHGHTWVLRIPSLQLWRSESTTWKHSLKHVFIFLTKYQWLFAERCRRLNLLDIGLDLPTSRSGLSEDCLLRIFLDLRERSLESRWLLQRSSAFLLFFKHHIFGILFVMDLFMDFQWI